MALLARHIRRNRWYRVNDSLPAVCLLDLEARDNALSFWSVDEQSKETLLQGVAIGIAATRDAIQNVDLALIDEDEITKAGISVQARMGVTPYVAVQPIHRQLINLSADDVLTIVKLIDARDDYQRYTAPEVRELLLTAIDEGRLILSELKDDVQRRLARSS